MKQKSQRVDFTTGRQNRSSPPGSSRSAGARYTGGEKNTLKNFKVCAKSKQKGKRCYLVGGEMDSEIDSNSESESERKTQIEKLANSGAPHHIANA